MRQRLHDWLLPVPDGPVVRGAPVDILELLSPLAAVRAGRVDRRTG